MAIRHKLRIIFKSGYPVDVTCSDCKLTSTSLNKLTQVALTDAKPDVGYINLDSIAAIFKFK